MEDSKSPKVSKETAEAEINAWLDYKKEDDRERFKDSIETLVKAIMSGHLIIQTKDATAKDYMQMVQTLKVPSDSADAIKKLTYKSRLSVAQTRVVLKGVKTDDLVAFGIAYGQALTGENSQIIANLDTVDFRITQAIAGFFS
jgi:hypothetical protein